MSLSNKYDCGCQKSTCPTCSSKSTRTYNTTTSASNCCNNTVQQAPAACCESHSTRTVAGICLNPSCNVVASTDDFYLTFSNLCQTLPIDGNVYFYHPAAGRMQIIAFDGTSYKVRLTDPTKAGGMIEQGDCVYVDIQLASDVTDTTTRCLFGTFIVPNIGANSDITIENGSSIPIGSSITFTANGETGTYQVVSFISASGNKYAYEVQNTGNGHTPGTIIDGGCSGVCTVPIEIIQDVDICDLSTTNDADSITACNNGSPRAFVPTGEGDVITGTAELTWELRKVTNLDCCVVLDGCVKFTDSSLAGITDTAVLKTTNIDCFEEAWDEAEAVGQYLSMNISGFDVVVTAYTSVTRAATFQVADASQVTGLIEYPEGTQVCLGDCCDSCVNGPQATDHKTFGGGAGTDYSALYNVNTLGDLKYGLGGSVDVTDAGGGQLLLTSIAHGMYVGEALTITGTTNYNNTYTVAAKTDDTMTVVGTYVSDQSGAWTADVQRERHYLIGFEYGTGTAPGNVIVKELDDDYNANPGSGPGKPLVEDPLVWRTKICNTSPDGCNQRAVLDYNYEIAFDPIPEGVRVNYELHQFAQGSATLADNSTPNPFTSISTQIASADYIDGPSYNATSILSSTNIGFGDGSQPKIYPYKADNFTNFMELEKNNCGLSIVWFYVQVYVLPSASVTAGTAFNSQMDIRQVIKKENKNLLPMPQNDPNQEDFKA